MTATRTDPLQVAIVPPPRLKATTEKEQLIARIVAPVYDIALNLAQKLVGEHAAGDAVHDALMELDDVVNTLQPEQQTSKYFLGIVRNHAVNELRRERLLVEITNDVRDENAAADLPDLPPFSVATKLGNEIEKIIYSMAPMRKEVFLLAKVGKRTHQDVAKLLGISVRTVSKHVELGMRDITNGFAKMGISISDGTIQQLLLRSSEMTDE